MKFTLILSCKAHLNIWVKRAKNQNSGTRAISIKIGLEWCILNNVNFSKEQTYTCTWKIITFIDFTIIAWFSNAF